MRIDLAVLVGIDLMLITLQLFVYFFVLTRIVALTMLWTIGHLDLRTLKEFIVIAVAVSSLRNCVLVNELLLVRILDDHRPKLSFI